MCLGNNYSKRLINKKNHSIDKKPRFLPVEQGRKLEGNKIVGNKTGCDCLIVERSNLQLIRASSVNNLVQIDEYPAPC